MESAAADDEVGALTDSAGLRGSLTHGPSTSPSKDTVQLPSTPSVAAASSAGGGSGSAPSMKKAGGGSSGGRDRTMSATSVAIECALKADIGTLQIDEDAQPDQEHGGVTSSTPTGGAAGADTKGKRKAKRGPRKGAVRRKSVSSESVSVEDMNKLELREIEKSDADRARIFEIVKNSILFSHLNPEAFARVR